jgi:hypothetical protein
VLIQKYGIEGLLVEESKPDGGKMVCNKIVPDAAREEATLTIMGQDSPIKVTLFDHLSIEIKAEMVEFRRSINMHFRGSLNINTMAAAPKSTEPQSLDLSAAVKKKSKKKI